MDDGWFDSIWVQVEEQMMESKQDKSTDDATAAADSEVKIDFPCFLRLFDADVRSAKADTED